MEETRWHSDHDERELNGRVDLAQPVGAHAYPRVLEQVNVLPERDRLLERDVAHVERDEYEASVTAHD